MATSNQTLAILIALILSIGLNIYLGVEVSDQQNVALNDSSITALLETISDSSFCNDSQRYENDNEKPLGGFEITSDSAKKIVDPYREKHPDEITGFNFSKKTLGRIFRDPRVNTLTIDLVNTDEKTIGVVIKGIRTVNTDLTLLNTPSNIFINQSMCPKDCSQW